MQRRKSKGEICTWNWHNEISLEIRRDSAIYYCSSEIDLLNELRRASKRRVLRRPSLVNEANLFFSSAFKQISSARAVGQIRNIGCHTKAVLKSVRARVYCSFIAHTSSAFISILLLVYEPDISKLSPSHLRMRDKFFKSEGCCM